MGGGQISRIKIPLHLSAEVSNIEVKILLPLPWLLSSCSAVELLQVGSCSQNRTVREQFKWFLTDWSGFIYSCLSKLTSYNTVGLKCTELQEWLQIISTIGTKGWNCREGLGGGGVEPPSSCLQTPILSENRL